MKWSNYSPELKGKWILVYKTVDERIEFPEGINVFGCTSFQGVFTPIGFKRGAYALIGEDKDPDAHAVLKECDGSTAKSKALEACEEIKGKLGKPSVILMHATPGFEERIIEGINEFFGNEVPVYGGSAGDDDLTGKWEIFLNGKKTNSGFLLVGFSGNVFGHFLSGYLPTDKKGKITRAQGRRVYEIDGKPAAIVYNEWTNGLIAKYLESGGVVLSETTLRPVGRVIGKAFGMPKYLLSHPHMVIPEDKSLTFFTEFKEGDEIILMSASKGALIKRSRQAVEMALSGRKYNDIRGGILIYCAGCVGVIINEVDETIREFKEQLGKGVPFIGCATFGEQGCFLPERENRHGNLMANAIIFAE